MKIVEEKTGKDKTKKYQFLTNDMHRMEACALFFENRSTECVICISSQLGCEGHCEFCNCGNIGFIRDLTSSEIIEEYELIVKTDPKLFDSELEVTYMGSGEPFSNIDSVLSSIKYLKQKYSMIKKFNISTIIPTLDIDASIFKDMINIVHLQFSLHFVNDGLRNKYFRKKLPTIAQSLDYLENLSLLINDKFCVNYILFNNINDSIEDAEELCRIVKRYNAYIKISEYIPICFSDLQVSQRHEDFYKVLDESGVEWKTFRSHGTDVNAACGHFLVDANRD